MSSEPPKTVAFLDPGYTLERIESIYAFISTDERGEGVAGAPMGGLGCVPLIAADWARVESIRPLAQQIAKAFGREVKLVKFTTREELESIKP
jgi:hypothetical protein